MKTSQIHFSLESTEMEGGRGGEIQTRGGGGRRQTFDGTHPFPVSLASFCLFKSNYSANRRDEWRVRRGDEMKETK
jgi:hypothetical protein